MPRARLFEHEPDARRVGASKALVLVGTDTCPACHGPVWRNHREELPLFRHGGYGASRTTERLFCLDFTDCGWSLDSFVGEHRPTR